MRFVLGLPNRRIDRQADFGSADGFGRLARAADRLGFYAFGVTDHPILPLAWEANGGHHDFDPIVTLAYLAGQTSQVRLLTHVLILPYRNPIPTAKALATLDRLSYGRLIVGCGSGYLEGEFEALGVPFAERNDLTDEAIRVFQALWTSDEPSFEGKYYRFSAVRQLPHPVQQPHPPIWVGGNSKRAVRRAVELGDAWAPFLNPPALAEALHTAAMITPEDFAERLEYAREQMTKQGRTRPLQILAPGVRVNVGGAAGSAERLGGAAATSKDEILNHLDRMKALGGYAYSVSFSGKTVEDYLAQMEWFGQDIIPETAGW